MGLSRFGLALGGLFGYTVGGWLLDWSRAVHTPALPWLVLAAIGLLTLTVLACAAAPLPQKKSPPVAG
jgi:DHA1 family multidrug resistance protein-like MFS transporter